MASVGFTSRHLPFTSSNTIIRIFRHALSIDERRAKFQPNPWHKSVQTQAAAKNDPESGTTVRDEAHEDRMQQFFRSLSEQAKSASKLGRREGRHRQHTSESEMEDVYRDGRETDVKEVWFAGCHTGEWSLAILGRFSPSVIPDVGGGSVTNTTTNSLANPSLQWMVNEVIAANTGILFKEGAFDDVPAFTLITVPDQPSGQTKMSPPRRAQTVSESTIVQRQGTHAQESTSATIVSVVENAMMLDCTAPIHDPLAKKTSIWWLLEWLPQQHHYQDAEGHWHKGW